MFTKAIVRTPSQSMVEGLTSVNLGLPDYSKALLQHKQYIKALQSCGLEVLVLDADEGFPDSTFVEDVALLTPYCAIITNPGAVARKGETEGLEKVLCPFFSRIETIQAPGTLEAGDVMMVGNHYYIGLSERTNEEGACQLIAILEKYGMKGATVSLEKVLHLKTGVAYLENNNLVVCGEFLEKMDFQEFNLLEIDEEDSYAANCVWVNGTVLIPQGFPRVRAIIEAAGYPVLEVDVSEFRKLDGGLSCLSLRF
ncbi:MAG: dimethylarginine dimethylaminohydrolase family protein [Marinifilaceae bacterium]|jgi:dimethylargininase